MVSLKAGFSIMQEHPGGVGSGDVVEHTKAWYAQHVPQMTIKGLYPSSEWLMYGAAAGWLGFIFFSVVMLLPFFEKMRYRFFWFTVSALMALSLLFDIGLEVQFGVFIYSFIMLCWWKWLRDGTADGARHAD